MNITIDILKTFFISIGAYIIALKIMNINKRDKMENIIIVLYIMAISAIISVMKNYTNFFISLLIQIIALAIILSQNTKNKFSNMLIATVISLSINYILFFIAISITYVLSSIMNIENDIIILTILSILDIFMIWVLGKVKKLKYGFSFLQKNIKNECFEMPILNISVILLFMLIVIASYKKRQLENTVFEFAIFAFIMFLTIQKSLQLYYKQKLLVQDLEKTKQELENKNKEIKNLEAENIAISKRNHTLDHKQKSLEHKIEEMVSKAEINKQEIEEAKEQLKEIGKELYKEKTTTELDKTEIPLIDDMLKYMQSECKKNKIDFELQLKGNINYMTNNLITKEDLETLLADHIKNAIIAINHTDNINRSILVRLGKIDEIYGLYIYDSGVEFEPETLKNLGQKPSTTHADEGGTGMGFMNTFDTLRKCKASLIIEEYNKPSKDNYTKALLIKFDNKNEFKIKSYREKQATE